LIKLRVSALNHHFDAYCSVTDPFPLAVLASPSAATVREVTLRTEQRRT